MDDVQMAGWVGMLVGVTIGVLVTRIYLAVTRPSSRHVTINMPGVRSDSHISATAEDAITAGRMIDRAMAATDRDMSGNRRVQTGPQPIPPDDPDLPF